MPDDPQGAERDGDTHSTTMDVGLTVRRALPGDALELLRWRNDPLVRAMSRTVEPIAEEAHLAWYTAACKDPDRVFLIGSAAGSSIGMVRFDRYPPSAWEASILLAPPARGHGLGRRLLSSALDFLESLQGPVVMLAEIRDSNTASIRLFESLGFRLTGSEHGLLNYRRA